MEQIEKMAKYCLNCKTKPCQSGCPLENDIPAFIENVKKQNYEEAYKILSKTTVLESVCGRICPHMSQCEGSCIRGIKGIPTDIGSLEAFIGDLAIKNNYSFENSDNGFKKTLVNKKIAVIGGGPAGLTCAAFLARKGASITIYEKHSELGGILVHGIPEFRLDRNIVKNTIQKIINLGIEVKLNKELGRDIFLQDLINQHDAVFLGIGANISGKMNIDGENLDGVFGGNELLEHNMHPNYEGKKVAVIGGGNVAMDCSRTIKRLGAKEVYVIYRRAEEQMPAEKKEVEDAKKEGIQFLFQNNIVKIVGNDKVEKIECIKTELVKKEGETRAVPVEIEESNYEIPMDYVVMAIGSEPEKEVVENLGLNISSKGYIIVDEKYMTSISGVFAGGDLIGQKATVAWAARAGRNAAIEIEKYIIC